MSNLKALCLALVCLVAASTAYGQALMLVTEDNPPFSFRDEGKIGGYSAELVEALVRETQSSIDHHDLFPWARAFQIALSVENVLIYSITRNEYREPLFKWVGPIADNSKHLYRLKSRDDIQVSSFADAENWIIGTVRSDSMSRVLLENGFVEGQNLDMVMDKNTNIRRLIVGRVDMVVNTELSMIYLLNKLNVDRSEVEIAYSFPPSDGYYIGFSRNTSDEIVSEFQLALHRLREQGVVEALMRKYY